MLNEKKRFSKETDHIDVKEKVRKLLSNDNNACFILITCKDANLEGKMQVEMTYEGDSTLASYLIDNAQEFFAQDCSMSQED